MADPVQRVVQALDDAMAVDPLWRPWLQSGMAPAGTLEQRKAAINEGLLRLARAALSAVQEP